MHDTGRPPFSRVPLWLGLALLFALALALRLSVITERDPFRDEATYSKIASEIAFRGNLFVENTWIDKPPLFFYLLAGLYWLFGATFWTGPILSLAVAPICILLVFLILERLDGRPVAFLGAALLAVCPHHVLYSSTVYIDPFLSTLLAGSTLAAVAGRAGLSGLLIGLALATKHIAVIFFPVPLALLLARYGADAGGPGRTGREILADLGRFALALAVVLLPAGVWLMKFQHSDVGSFWISNRPEVLDIRVEGFFDKLGQWMDLASEIGVFFGSSALRWFCLLAVPAGVVLELARVAGRGSNRRTAWQRLLLHGTVTGYFFFFSVTEVPKWRHYLIVIQPFLWMSTALIAADVLRGLIGLAGRLPLRPPRPRRLASLLRGGGLFCTGTVLCAGLLWLWQNGRTYYDPPVLTNLAALVHEHRRDDLQTLVHYNHRGYGWRLEYLFCDGPFLVREKLIRRKKPLERYLLQIREAVDDIYLVYKLPQSGSDESTTESAGPELARILAANPGHELLGRAADPGLLLYYLPKQPAAFQALTDVTATSLPVASVLRPAGRDSGGLEILRDGDWPPLASRDPTRQVDTADGTTQEAPWIGYLFAHPIDLEGMQYQEGLQTIRGGWLRTLRIEVLDRAGWKPYRDAHFLAPYGSQHSPPFSRTTARLDTEPVWGLRVSGITGGRDGYISAGELRVYGDVPELPERLEELTSLGKHFVQTGSTGQTEVILRFERKHRFSVAQVQFESRAGANGWSDLPRVFVHRDGRWHRVSWWRKRADGVKERNAFLFPEDWKTAGSGAPVFWIVFFEPVAGDRVRIVGGGAETGRSAEGMHLSVSGAGIW